MKYARYIKEHFSKPDFPVFRISDIKIQFQNAHISEGYIYLMLHNLVKRGEAIRITRSIYTLHKDSVVVGFAFAPFYYGLENALSIRGISNQGTNFIVVTPRNVRTGIRTFKGRNYRVQRIQKQHMFGYETIKYGEFWIQVSDVEKSLIDILYFQKGIRDELLNEIIPKINRNKLKNYLKRYGKSFSKRVMAIYEKP